MMRIPIICLCLIAALSVRAELHVSGGHLNIQDGYLVELGSVVVRENACLKLGETAVLSASSLSIETNGMVKGSGTLDANVFNNGTLLGNGGPGTIMTITGTTTNNGTIRMVDQTALDLQGQLTHEGLLDLIMSPSSPPVSLGGGEIVSANTIPPMSMTVGSHADLQLTAYPGHRYAVSRTSSLTETNSWVAVGSEFSVTTRELIAVSDTDISTNAVMFYRYEILD